MEKSAKESFDIDRRSKIMLAVLSIISLLMLFITVTGLLIVAGMLFEVAVQAGCSLGQEDWFKNLFNYI